MYQNPNLPASRFRLATDAGRSAPRNATRGGRSVRRALMMVGLSMVLVGAASYPAVVATLLTLAVVAFVSRRIIRTRGRAHVSDRKSGTDPNPTHPTESSS